MSENAGLVIRTPTEIPIIVVIANPFSKPAPAHIRGRSETNDVKYAPIIIANALFRRCFKLTSKPWVDSSNIIIDGIWKRSYSEKFIPALQPDSDFHKIEYQGS